MNSDHDAYNQRRGVLVKVSLLSLLPLLKSSQFSSHRPRSSSTSQRQISISTRKRNTAQNPKTYTLPLLDEQVVSSVFFKLTKLFLLSSNPKRGRSEVRKKRRAAQQLTSLPDKHPGLLWCHLRDHWLRTGSNRHQCSVSTSRAGLPRVCVCVRA